MKVYLLVKRGWQSGSSILGVFDSQEKAVEIAIEETKNFDGWSRTNDINWSNSDYEVEMDIENYELNKRY